MDKLLLDFKNSIFNDNLEVIGDYAEIGIDSFIEEGILKEIPIVNTIVSGLKIAKNVYDRNLLKQTLSFINEFNSKEIAREKYERYKQSLENNPKRLNQELSRVLILLNANIDIDKSVILAKLYRAYIEEYLSWDEFIEFSDITSRLFINDLQILKTICCKGKDKYKEKIGDRFRVERIYSLGLIGNIFPNTIEVNHFHGKILNEIGEKYCDIIFK